MKKNGWMPSPDEVSVLPPWCPPFRPPCGNTGVLCQQAPFRPPFGNTGVLCQQATLWKHWCPVSTRSVQALWKHLCPVSTLVSCVNRLHSGLPVETLVFYVNRLCSGLPASEAHHVCWSCPLDMYVLYFELVFIATSPPSKRLGKKCKSTVVPFTIGLAPECII